MMLMREVLDPKPEDYFSLSSTKVRDLLAAGQPLPKEFARPEVAAILATSYQAESGRVAKG